ncbi:hypothetical protein WCX18_12825 [Sulfurimonas sp. HSL1-2]|uniref:hypothetical protein n=1 Tax=Thiomicrolovo zhangzhouensis TaxID=3131933 RepID=UPI0031F74025
MKPLSTPSAAATLLERIIDGEGAMLRSLALNGPTTATLTLSVQDKHRGYDWIDIVFEISGMNDAKLVDDKQLGFIDTDEGITVVFENGQWGLAVGRYGGMEALKSAPLYVIGTSLKYEEAPFSG